MLKRPSQSNDIDENNDKDDEDDFFENPLKRLKPKLDSLKAVTLETEFLREKSLETNNHANNNKLELISKHVANNVLANSEADLSNDNEEDEVICLSSPTNSDSSYTCILDNTGDLGSNSFTDDAVADDFCTVQLNDMVTGKSKIHILKMNFSLDELTNIYSTLWKCSKKCVRLSAKNGEDLDPSMTPKALNFTVNAVNVIFALKVASLDPENVVNLKFVVRESKPFCKSFEKSLNFGEIKSAVAEMMGIKEKQIRLVFDNEYIDDNETPSTLEMEDNDCIDVFLVES
uniref:Ubiquitin-like domain-containing protein n=1 Tax=Syphacia muris TaxID=451379 RepID=A0A0N5ANN5_9BILA